MVYLKFISLRVFGTLFFVVSFFTLLFPQPPQQYCGTPDFTPTENLALRNGLPDPWIPGTISYQIPVWVTLVRNNSGFSKWNDVFAPYQLIDDVNTFFNNDIQFTLCGITIVNNDDWYNCSTINTSPPIPPIPSEWDQLESYVNNENIAIPKGYIDIFLVGSIVEGVDGFAGAPNGVNDRNSVLCGDYRPKTVAHELGHYFGLNHTHSGGHLAGNPPEAAQYVDDPVEINGDWFTGEDTGDFVSDTPADAGGTLFCTDLNSCTSASCSVSDPHGKTYTPDPTILMSYYHACADHFTTGQNQRMYDFLTGNARWDFLMDPALEPTCQTNPVERGYIIRNCPEKQPPLSPIKGVEVTLEDANGSACGQGNLPITNENGEYPTYECVFPSYTGTGLLSVLPEKNHGSPTLGVDLFDLIDINEHILGITPFTTPFQYIAADEDMSGSITTTDAVNIHKVLINYPGAFLHSGSWRYVPRYCFEDPAFNTEFFDDDDLITIGVQPDPFPAVWINPDEPISPPTVRHYVNNSGLLPNSESWMDHVSIDPNGAAFSDDKPWSFWAIKVGDMDCGAEGLGGKPEDQDRIEFIPELHTALAANQEFLLKVVVKGTTLPIKGWQLGIGFSTETIELLEVLPGNTSETFSLDNFGLWDLTKGEFRAIYYSPNGRADILENKTIFKIRVRALKAITDINRYFSLNSDILSTLFADQYGNKAQIRLSFQVTEISPGLIIPSKNGIQSKLKNGINVTVSPNPFSTELVFDFYNPKDGLVTLNLFDNVGNVVSQYKELQPKGYSTIRLEGSNRTNGLYWYRLETPVGMSSGKVIKL